MKGYDKNKESSYLKYWDVNNLYGWAMQQKLPVNKFECFEDTSKFIEDFINDVEGYFLKFMFSTLKKYMSIIMILSERIKIEKIEKLVTILSLSH